MNILQIKDVILSVFIAIKQFHVIVLFVWYCNTPRELEAGMSESYWRQHSHLALISCLGGSVRRRSVLSSQPCADSVADAKMKLSGLLAAVFLLCAEWRGFGMSHPKPACRYPPSQWCRSLEIAIECRVSPATPGVVYAPVTQLNGSRVD